MTRDIDRIIDAVQRRFPAVTVQQHRKIHPPDDDGLWWFSLPDEKQDIQIESPRGECPFLVEEDDVPPRDAHSVQEVVDIITAFLESLSRNLPRDVVGTIVGHDARCVVVELEGGQEVLCRGWKRLHFEWGFHKVPTGMKARIQLCPKSRPLLMEVLRTP